MERTASPRPPDGVVTFLYSDIEGSTRMLEAAPDAAVRAIEEHVELLDDAIGQGGGVVFRSTGDGLCAAFVEPAGALHAAALAQRAMASHTWVGVPPVRVRIALHTGEATWLGRDYRGAALFRVARLMALAQGGQTLVSGQVAKLVATMTPASTTLVARGEYRLRDLADPEDVWELVLDETPGPLRPLRSGATRREAFVVGRAADHRRVAELLGHNRLVTLTGLGGIGKTTLAREVLADRDRDAWYVDLAPLRALDDVAPATAAALGLVEGAADAATTAVPSFLSSRSAGLLVLDNAEHLPGIGHLVRRWLDAAPGISVLATSRVPLRVAGEREVALDGLALPEADEPGAVEASPAGALFLRAARATGALEVLDVAAARDVRALVARLDGIPLALELAAGRSRTVSPAALLRLLDDPGVLASDQRTGSEERHASLDRVVAMSVDLLAEDERRLLTALAACPGPFHLPLARAVVPSVVVVPAVEGLVTAGLVRPMGEVAGEARFRLLETIRAFMTARADALSQAGAVERLAGATIAEVERLNALRPTNAQAAADGLIVIDAQVSLAVDWLRSHDPSQGLRLLVAWASQALWGIHLARSVAWHRAMVDAAPLDDPRRPAALSTLLRLLARYAGPAEALELEPELVASATVMTDDQRRSLHLALAHAWYAAGDADRTIEHMALAANAARDPDDRRALELQVSAERAWVQDRATSRAVSLQLLSAGASERAGQAGNQGIQLFKAAQYLLAQGEAAAAIPHARRSVELCPPGGTRAFAIDTLAMALADVGRTADARAAVAAAWTEVEREALIDRIEALEAAACVLAAEGRVEEAVTAFAVADRDRPLTGWAWDSRLAVPLGRWQARCIDGLVPDRLEAARRAAEGLTVDRAMAAMLSPS